MSFANYNPIALLALCLFFFGPANLSAVTSTKVAQEKTIEPLNPKVKTIQKKLKKKLFRKKKKHSKIEFFMAMSIVRWILFILAMIVLVFLVIFFNRILNLLR